MKVFLSHSTKDKQFVKALAVELENEKIKPWLCEIDVSSAIISLPIRRRSARSGPDLAVLVTGGRPFGLDTA
jgi:hypothetical protein